MNKLIFLIFKTKITFLRPKKAEIMLYDQGVHFNYLFIKSFKNITFEIFYKRLEKINFYILFYTILKNGLKNLKFNYLLNYIDKVNPKIIITNNDVDTTFYKLKKNIKNTIKTISIQRSFKEKNEFNHFKLQKIKYSSDYLLLFSLEQKKYFKKYIDSKFIVIGSCINNFYKKKIQKKNQIIFISEFIKKNLNKSKFFHEKKILIFLLKYCEKKKIKLKILLKNLSGYDYVDKKDNISIKIYRKYFDFVKPKNIISQSRNKTNYDYLDSNKLAIFMDSNLGVETISRGNKTLRIPSIKIKNKIDSFFGKIEYDLHALTTYSKFENKLNLMISKNNKKFNFNKLLYHQKNNKILKRIINQIIL
mgnify:FL=1|jgi:surface carbohydrate biosynthesis protein